MRIIDKVQFILISHITGQTINLKVLIHMYSLFNINYTRVSFADELTF
jgi:hypothetical protein